MQWPRVITTARLMLRMPGPADAQRVFERYGRDERVVRYVNWRPHQTLTDSRNLVNFDIHRWLKGSAWVWMLAPVGSDSDVFGQVELLPMSYPSEAAHHLRLGYLMAASHWGQGYMQEAVAAVLDVAFAMPGVWRVDALCDTDNAASIRLLERSGMQREGCMRRAVRHPNVSEEPRDVWVYARVRSTG